jgi:uncharacterized membrane protein YdjX (TVP38/TMEM64 family)
MDETQQNSRRMSLGRIAIAVGVVTGLLLLARQAGQYLPIVASWVEDLGSWGPLAFVIVYALAVVAFVPGVLLTLAGGALFDLFWGTIYVFIAAVLGSSAAFLTARYGARAAVESRLGSSQRFASLDRAIGDQGLKIVFLLRLSPAFPFNFMNYAIGLTRVSFRDYLLASPGMLPATVLYVYYGKLIGDVAAIAGGVAPARDTRYYAVLMIGLAATVGVTAVVTRLARGALADASTRKESEQ